HDTCEIGINGDIQPPLVRYLAQRPGHLEFLDVQDHAGNRAPPQDRLTRAVPGKYAMPVSIEHTWQRKVAAGGEQPVGIIERGIDRWKLRARAKPGDHTIIVPALVTRNKPALDCRTDMPRSIIAGDPL